MRVMIDACVLYPTVMREITLGVARTGAFTPLWSPRILEEWARAAARLGAGQDDVARGEIALLKTKLPKAELPHDPATEADLYLPDPDDIHVLAAAIAGRADAILTLNLKDFPTRTLADHGILRRDPDGFLTEAYHANPDEVSAVARNVHATAERLSGDTLDLRKLMKRARLPRLGKALTA